MTDEQADAVWRDRYPFLIGVAFGCIGGLGIIGVLPSTAQWAVLVALPFMAWDFSRAAPQLKRELEK